MSTFIAQIEARYADLVTALGLSRLGAAVLHALVTLDLQGASADDDEHGRQGVVSWRRLVERTDVDDADLDQVERELVRMAAWGVLQIVGRHPSDPILLGSAAVRLTHPGRAALGLAPQPRRALTFSDDAVPWLILHAHSREALYQSVQDRFGVHPSEPVVASADSQGLAHLVGTVAATMLANGVVVVDGFDLVSRDRAVMLPQVIRRTAMAHLPRVMLVPDPSIVRLAALATGARLEWVETALHTRRGDVYLDQRVTDRLVAMSGGESSVADLAGVPGTDIATPRRVDTRWEDLVVPRMVQTQLEQAKMHASFRLNTLPTRPGFSGKSGGFRLLLSGLPGTGKSMAAEALATSLSRPVVRLDLSAVLSKWLGETETLIGQIFDLAEAAGAVLVLDEAEALFRQRKGGGGGSDALMTAVAFLLTRLDRFEGVLVATTNRTQDLDDAFFRRFDDFIVLPMPDEETRAVLWQMFLPCGVEDRAAVLGALDLAFLSRRFVLSGGLIRGACIRANGWAQGLSSALTMPIVLGALARELEKADRNSGEVMVEPYRQAVAALLGDRRAIEH